MNLATARLNEAEKCKKQELEHVLMLVRGRGEDFQKPIGELDQPASMVC